MNELLSVRPRCSPEKIAIFSSRGPEVPFSNYIKIFVLFSFIFTEANTSDFQISWPATIQLLTYQPSQLGPLHFTIHTHRERPLSGEEFLKNNGNRRTRISTLLRPCGWEVRRNGRAPSLRDRLLRRADPPLYLSLDLRWQLLHYCRVDIFDVEHPGVTARGFTTTMDVASICSLHRHIVFFSFVCFWTPWT